MHSPEGGRLRRRAVAVFTACLAGGVGFGPATALAELSPVVFSIEASSSLGSGSWQFTFDQLNQTGDGLAFYSWNLPERVIIRDRDTGVEIASLSAASVFYQFDPTVVVQFTVTSGAVDTDFTITSALNSFAAINNAFGRASAGVTVTDVDGDGASLTGLGVGGAAYEAHYNGMVPGGSSFADLLFNPVVAEIAGTASDSASFPGLGAFQPIAGSVTDMSARFSFRLSANDIASGTSNYEIIPEAGSLAVIGLGIVIGVRRRRLV